jgi:hypothetical protein
MLVAVWYARAEACHAAAASGHVCARSRDVYAERKHGCRVRAPARLLFRKCRKVRISCSQAVIILTCMLQWLHQSLERNHVRASRLLGEMEDNGHPGPGHYDAEGLLAIGSHHSKSAVIGTSTCVLNRI